MPSFILHCKGVVRITQVFLMQTDFFCIKRWSFFLSALILAAMCAQVVYFQFDLTQKYAEFIVGSITWRSANKFHDYALLFTFVIGFLILIRLIFNVISGLSRKCGSDCIEQLHDFFAYLCVPAGLWFIGLLSSKSDALLLLNFSGILLLTALFFLSIFLSKARKFFQCEAFQFISMFRGIFFILFAVGFVVISLGLLGSRLSGLFHFKSYINSNIVFDVVVGGEIFAIIWLSTAIVVSETIKQLEIKFQKALFVLQCFLPALFLILIPTPWVDEGQLVIGYPLTAAAFSIILLCIGATYFDLFRCYHRNKTISILCLIAILLFQKITPVLAPVISLDDYHFGELLVPWWSWSKQPNHWRHHNDFAYPVNTINKPTAISYILQWALANRIIGMGSWGKWEHMNSDVAVNDAMITVSHYFEWWSMAMKISLCLMVYNELKGCKIDIPELPLSSFDEIYAIDGGSTDGTVEYLQAQNIPVFQQQKKGLNAAYLEANQRATGDAVVVFFPKASLSTEDLCRFRPLFEQGYQLIIASRQLLMKKIVTCFARVSGQFITGLCCTTHMVS